MKNFEKPDEGGAIERTPERLEKERNVYIKDLELALENLGENLEGEEKWKGVLKKALETLNEATPEQIDWGISKAMRIRETQDL